MTRFLAALVAIVLTGPSAGAEVMRMAVTTSFHNSGLAEVLLPEIAKDTGIEVQLLVVGTGQALRLGAAGDADAVLVHSRTAEEAFIAAGHATRRREIMYNDFVFVGPSDDPAGVIGAPHVAGVLGLIEGTKSTFISRGDDSGTHKREQALWREAELEPDAFGTWYRAVGSGMGASLNAAAGMGAYIMTDRASWLNFGNKADLILVFSDDPVLFNQYAYLPVNPARHAHVKSDLVQQLEDWLTSPRAAELINDYRIAGERLFTFNAK